MKTKVLSVRLEEFYVEFLEELESSTHIERANILRALISAAKAYYDEHGFLQLPLRIVPKLPPKSPPRSGSR